MVAQPESVPAARRFVGGALLDWGCRGLVDDAATCVTELSTNATLHSDSTYFDVEIELCADTVRVAVADTGPGPGTAESQSVLRAEPGDGSQPGDAAMTGRGLLIVAALATAWGIDQTPSGKRVWVELVPDGPPVDVHPPQITGPNATTHPAADDCQAVVLRDCPVALAVAHDENVADIVRELQLIQASPANRLPARVTDVLTPLVEQHAVTWDAGRLLARDALRAERDFADIEVPSSPTAAAAAGAVRQALHEADALAERGLLMTPPAPPEVQRVRDWIAEEFVGQAERGRPPRSYRSWVSQHDAS